MNWENCILTPKVVAHIHHPEFAGNGQSWYTLHGGVPKPLQPAVHLDTVTNKLPPPLMPTSQSDGTEAAEATNEAKLTYKSDI